jgi:4-alpha-glucanotransferase
MKVKFRIEYFTDENKRLAVSYILNGEKNESPLYSDDGKIWTGEVDLEYSASLVYTYKVYEDDKVVGKEWGAYPHKLFSCHNPSTYMAFDSWIGFPQFSYLYTNAAQTAFFCSQEKEPLCANIIYPHTLILQTDIPYIKRSQKLLLCGNWIDWDLTKSLPLDKTENGWEISLNMKYLKFPFEYKFVIYDKLENSYVWQTNNNYIFDQIDAKDESSVIVISNIRPDFPFEKPRAAGIVLPIFSLRTKNSFGAGDFGDIKTLVDWSFKCNMRVIQTLPVNDTSSGGTWMDASPYCAISVFALHPIYLDLNQLPTAKEDAYLQERDELNSYEIFDYEKVNAAKRKWALKSFDINAKEIFESKEYENFFKQNKYWLISYAAFSYLRDINKTSDFNKWGKYSKFNIDDINELCLPDNPAYKDLSFYFYIQYYLHKQLLESSEYAASKGIMLKGDIPIGISCYSVDVWENPHYFDTNESIGAPPDIFSLDGQNWGFPNYNWDEMDKDDYLWWKNRLKNMSQYFSAYRIDHILGFFRIWQIPKNSVYGLLGQFCPALPLSKDEIKSFGFEFKKEYTEPYINDKILSLKFGDLADKVKNEFLIKNENGFYSLYPSFDSQQKVEAFFYAKNNKDDKTIKDGLFSIISDVLFVKDYKDASLYHPRILADLDNSFLALSKDEQDAYMKIYNNYFYQRHNDFWRKAALKKLPSLLQASSMLCCAEDLGMIPKCVPEVLNDLQILSLEIERYPKREGETFADTSKHPYLSVCSVSTHDTSTLRGFWKEDIEKTRLYYREILKHSGEAPEEASPEICRGILARSLKSPSMLCMFLFQDWISINENLRKKDIESERINVPGSPKDSWRYRMHLPIETLIDSDELNNAIKDLIAENGRALQFVRVKNLNL